MSDPSPFSGGPLGDLLRNLARLLTAQGPLNWDVASQLAAWTATEGATEPNPDPLARVNMEELLRVADMHVAEATGMATSRRGWLALATVTRTDWASRTLQAWKPVLTQLASSLNSGASAMSAGITPAPDEQPSGAPDNPMDQLLGNLPQVIGPWCWGRRPVRWSVTWPAGRWGSTTCRCRLRAPTN